MTGDPDAKGIWAQIALRMRLREERHRGVQQRRPPHRPELNTCPSTLFSAGSSASACTRLRCLGNTPTRCKPKCFGITSQRCPARDLVVSTGSRPDTTAAAYRAQVPLRDYNGFKPWVEAVREGEENVLWPGAVRWHAKSSGTTTDRSKFIPVTEDALEKCHYKGGKDLLAMYVDAVPKARLYGGRHLIVGGTGRAQEADNGVLTGDLSAIIINNLPWWCEWRRTPARSIALMASWEEKIERMAETTINQDVRIIAGVPSWTQVLLERILERTGKNHLGEVWPHLQLYMHGGVAFAPYREAPLTG